MPRHTPLQVNYEAGFRLGIQLIERLAVDTNPVRGNRRAVVDTLLAIPEGPEQVATAAGFLRAIRQHFVPRGATRTPEWKGTGTPHSTVISPYN